MRILGIDLGKKRIGLALGDTESRIAIGLPTIQNNRQVVENIKAVIEGERIQRLIIGLPKTMSGGTGEQAGYTQKWAAKIKELLGIEVVYEDERLSSKMARDGLLALGHKLKKEDIDQAAAVLILQSYLDRLG
ncbi:Holliday junction resolvase RuvX [Patescibacteria group bacterium]|nr:Holliday junction resolvase RuvX [Patescibacteria group bacterium]